MLSGLRLLFLNSIRVLSGVFCANLLFMYMVLLGITVILEFFLIGPYNRSQRCLDFFQEFLGIIDLVFNHLTECFSEALYLIVGFSPFDVPLEQPLFGLGRANVVAIFMDRK